MTDEQSRKCHMIIHSASSTTGAIGAGLAQLPSSDNALIVPIQIAMIISLGSVFMIELSKSSATSTLATATASLTGRTLSQLLIGWIPIAGNIINASTAFSITELIGWNCAHTFDSLSRKRKK